MSPEVEKLTLELWREREQKFPVYCRRMTPDDVDRATGAWKGMVQRAEAIIRGMKPSAKVLAFPGVKA